MNGRFQQLVQLPRRVLSLFVHGAGRIQQVADDTKRVSKIGVETAKATSEIGKRTMRLESDVGSLTRDVRELVTELQELRKELRDRLLQYNLQLGRLSRTATGDDEAPPLSGRTVAFELPDRQAPGWEPVGDQPHPDPEGREWLTLDACPMCRHAERTIVNEWNKLVLMDKAPDPSSARYDFAVCHACGVAYATRRPIGQRYRFLNLNFGEVTAKHGGDAEFTNPLLNPYPLTDADRRTLKRRAERGVFVSEHLGLRSNEYLEGLLKDRFENSVHLDLIGALLSPTNARVLEIRPRTGMISEGLRRLYGADVHAMPIWESQRFLLEEVYGIESSGLVDYDQFAIPAAGGQFDLIVCNHMLTHAVRPHCFFDAVHHRLKPGGHVYFYNEPDDAEYLIGNQSMLATLNPLHMQAFDQKSLARALAANRLEVVFQKRRLQNHICLARLTETAFTPMTDKERIRRVRAYRRSRDRAILSLRGDLRARFADEWQQIVERSVANRLAEFDAEGNLRLIVRTKRASG
jgi:2-polyprenyl-3-methyl-5-hydroxy-6-metoxy-1,4-benzoquinol methylase